MAGAVKPNIVVAGAGSIGCYIGGCLAEAGRNVTLLLRPSLAGIIASHGLRLSDLTGADRTLPSSAIRLATDPAAAFADADVVLVTVKCGDTAAMARLLAEHAPDGITVVSLQNGVSNVDALLANVGGTGRIVAGMVPFNVVQTHGDGGAARFHRATSGTVLIGSGQPGLKDVLNVPAAKVTEHADMPSVLWSKLLRNLNNALVALSDMPLATQLSDKRWRRILARQIAEALGVLRKAGVEPARMELAPKMIPRVLRLPDWLFRRVAARMLAVDPQARSSMWEDLTRGRSTEIDYLQGAVQALARKHNVRTPVTDGIIRLVKQAEAAKAGSLGLSADALERAIK